jgi:hypothetical protein
MDICNSSENRKNRKEFVALILAVCISKETIQFVMKHRVYSLSSGWF